MSAFSRGLFLWAGCARAFSARTLDTPFEAIRSQFTATSSNNFMIPREFSSASILQASKKIRAAQAKSLRGPKGPGQQATNKQSSPFHKVTTKLPTMTGTPSSTLKAVVPLKTVAKIAAPTKVLTPLKTSTPLPSKVSTIYKAVLPAPAILPAQYSTFASTLASKVTPTPLYESPSHTQLIVTCTTLSILLFLAGISIYYELVINRPMELPVFVPITYILISFGLFAAATWLGTRPINLIKSISALPSGTSLNLEVILRSRLPFFKDRKLQIPASKIKLPRPITAVVPKPDPAEQIAIRNSEREKHAADLAYERSHVMTRPFRHGWQTINKVTVGGWRLIRRTMNDGAFLKMQIGDQKCQLDTKGWMYENGRALDRLFSVGKN
ncbi:hypothetical protein BJ878DRAFT_543571 [Calycina marina]|uniref:Uncharacterized protein n=1 Tax=Calycina marina TaxID=1763456 RepID=A0A9P7Z037_9HELO|nr:hypothetical protein BJ878DRAFT_543571 [Calycina marina]